MATKLELMIEAEKRGILPSDKVSLLNEARSRGLIKGSAIQAPQQQEPGFGARVGESFRERQETVQEAKRATPFRAGTKAVAEAVRFGGDVVGEGLVSAGRGISAITPDPIGAAAKKVAKFGLESLGETLIAKGGIAALQAGAKVAGAVEEKFPETVDVLKDVATVGSIALGGKSKPGKITEIGEDLIKKGKVNTPKLKKLTSDDIKIQASKLYDTAESKGGSLKSNVTDDFLDNLSKEVGPQTEAGRIFAGKDDEITAALERLEGLRGRPLSLREAQELDKQMGDLATKFFITDKSVSRKIGIMQDELRGAIENAKAGDIVSPEGFEALKEGRKLWARASRLDEVERIIARAELTDNPASALRSGFRTLLGNKRRMRGFSEVEREMITKAAKSGIISDAAGVLGSRLIPIASVATGGGLGGAAAAQATSTASRSVATRVQLNKAAKLAESIANPGRNKPTLFEKGKPITQKNLGRALKNIEKAIVTSEQLALDKLLIIDLLEKEE